LRIHRIDSYLLNLAGEIVRRKRIDRLHALAVSPDDISLIDVGDHLHLGKIVGNREQCRRRKDWRHCLAHVHVRDTTMPSIGD